MDCSNIIELEILEDETNMDLNVEFQGDIIRLGGGEFIETDPTVPEWAKQPNPPTYTPEDIGALSKKDVDQVFDPESENAQSGLAVAEALKNNTSDFIYIGTFSYIHELKTYPFEEHKLYSFYVDGEVLQKFGEPVNEILLGEIKFQGSGDNPFKTLYCNSYLTDNGGYYMIYISDETVTVSKIDDFEEPEEIDLNCVYAGSFDTMKELQDYGFERYKLYMLSGNGDLENIGLKGPFIAYYVTSNRLQCFRADLSVSIVINLTTGSVVSYYDRADDHAFVNAGSFSDLEGLLVGGYTFKFDKVYKIDIEEPIITKNDITIDAGTYIARYYFNAPPLDDGYHLDLVPFVPNGKSFDLNCDTGVGTVIKLKMNDETEIINAGYFQSIEEFKTYNFVLGKMYQFYLYDSENGFSGLYIGWTLDENNGFRFLHFQNCSNPMMHYRFNYNAPVGDKDIFKYPVEIEDANNYYTDKTLEGVLQEIGAKLNVDQIFDPESENAQSGKALSDIVLNYAGYFGTIADLQEYNFIPKKLYRCYLTGILPNGLSDFFESLISYVEGKTNSGEYAYRTLYCTSLSSNKFAIVNLLTGEVVVTDNNERITTIENTLDGLEQRVERVDFNSKSELFAYEFKENVIYISWLARGILPNGDDFCISIVRNGVVRAFSTRDNRVYTIVLDSHNISHNSMRIDDVGNYYYSDHVDGVLQEIGAKFGDIDIALANIIALQENYIGGATE